MSHVSVTITWNGQHATANPDPVKVKLSNGQDKVKWSSTQDFSIEIDGSTINATGSGTNWTADSKKFSSPANYPYTIRAASGGPGSDPEVQVET